MKACICFVCHAPLTVGITPAEKAEAEANFGATPTGEGDDGFLEICHECFLTLSVCTNCNEHGLSKRGPCPTCGSMEVLRGQACVQYDKDHGVIGDGTVKWPE